MAKLDRTSRKILRELTRDGRIANTQLSERVGLSPSACLRRVQEMGRAGVITGYRAVLDPGAIVFLVQRVVDSHCVHRGKPGGAHTQDSTGLASVALPHKRPQHLA